MSANMSMSRWLGALCALLLALPSAHAGGIRGNGEGFEGELRDWIPTGKGEGHHDSGAPGRVTPRAGFGRAGTPGALSGNGISFHGGPVILGNVNVYYLWYGDWSTTSTGNAQQILQNLASTIGGSAYYNINTTYNNGAGTALSNRVTYAGATADPNRSLGAVLNDSQVRQIVANAINGGSLPNDANAVYFVLTDPGVQESSGFCTKYCGWHGHSRIKDNIDVKYAFVGNPAKQCPASCSAQTTKSPNGNPGADAMASVIVHELEEAHTDPALNAWYDSRGAENADKCAWKFGTTSLAPNGSKYNVVLGGSNYLIQQNWVNANGGYCALTYP